MLKIRQNLLPDGAIKIRLPELPGFDLLGAQAQTVARRLKRSLQRSTKLVRARAVSIQIPDGSIYVDAPTLMQPNNYSCALAAASIARMYGVGPDSFVEFMQGMKTKKSGTFALNIAAYLNKLGLDARVKNNMSKSELMDLLDEEICTILAIQAWAENSADYDDPKINDNGHYVSTIGYSSASSQDDVFYFMDPSILCRYGYLPWRELDRRWHDNDGSRRRPKLAKHMGIIVRPNGHEPINRSVAELIE